MMICFFKYILGLEATSHSVYERRFHRSAVKQDFSINSNERQYDYNVLIFNCLNLTQEDCQLFLIQHDPWQVDLDSLKTLKQSNFVIIRSDLYYLMTSQLLIKSSSQNE